MCDLVERDGPVGLYAASLFAHAELLAVLVHHRALEAVEQRRHLLGRGALARLRPSRTRKVAKL